MNYINKYNSPLGIINLRSDGEYLTGLWFKGSYDNNKNKENSIEKELEIFNETKKWLDIYFSGINPNFTIKIKSLNETPFRKMVDDIMTTIPYGKTMTYGEISSLIAKKKSIKKMSSRAVGHAVGSNNICIILPCHRVVGKNGNLTGYGGGIKNKIELLKLEHNDMSNFIIPKRGNKL